MEVQSAGEGARVGDATRCIPVPYGVRIRAGGGEVRRVVKHGSMPWRCQHEPSIEPTYPSSVLGGELLVAQGEPRLGLGPRGRRRPRVPDADVGPHRRLGDDAKAPWRAA